MANPVIKVKRSSVAGKVPAPTQLERGELAVNSYDGKVYIVRDQFSTGIGTTTHTLNPWDEYTIGNKIAYAGIASAQQFDGNITGSVNSSGISTFGNNVHIADNKKILFGASNDLEIFHQTSNGNSIIRETGGGSLSIQSNGDYINFWDSTNGVAMAQFQNGGACSLRHGANIRLQTASAGITVTGDLAVSGNFTGDSTFTGDITGTGDLYLTDTGTDSSAGPIIDLYRNSSSAADADYMGQIKFQGENDADQKIVYAKITGKIQDASDGTEDGLLEFSNKKAGSNVITARLRSDSLQLLNGTSLTVAGDSTHTGRVIANHGVTGNINSAGISTISGFTFPSTDGTEDQALVTDGSGSLSFKTLSGGSASSGAGTTISTGVTTATQGQTSFTAPNVFDDGSQATAFSTQVFLNGIKQRLGASNDYQLSAPQTVNFTSGVNVGDDVTIVVYFGHTLEEEFFTATQGQKDFTLSGNLAAAKNYKVFLNGVRLRNTVDYSASAAVVLTQAARAGEQVDIVSDQAEDRLTAVENQTSFAPSDSGTTSDNMQVYMNGVLLRQTEDWSIGSPSVTILDADGLTAGDHLDVVVRRS